MISQDELKSILNYDKNTGIFTWNLNKWRVFKGMKAGTLYKTGYIIIRINRKGYSAHRLAWLYTYGSFPTKCIDHINHIKDDNRIENLRVVSHSENMKNKSLHSKNKTGYSGIFFRKNTKIYQAQIRINGKNKYLGSFEFLSDAIEARKKAMKKESYHDNHGVNYA